MMCGCRAMMPCRTINALGEQALAGGEVGKRAEKMLVELLSEEGEEPRWISIRFLMSLAKRGTASDETLAAIERFKAVPTNARILPREEELV